MKYTLNALLALVSFGAFAQGPSFTQYTVKDGLPGSIVYQALQDREGYIWFATNQGVSRFDGKTFRNFTKDDGLPDNDVLRMYLDTNNVLWFISFSGVASVYYNGHIRRIDGCSGVFAISEDYDTRDILLFSDNKQVEGWKIGYFRSRNLPGRWRFADSTHSVDAGWNGIRDLWISARTGMSFDFRLNHSNPYELDIREGGLSRRYTMPLFTGKSMMTAERRNFITFSPYHTAIVFFTDNLYRADTGGIRKILSLKSLHLDFGDINGIVPENDSTLWLCTRNQGLLRLVHLPDGERRLERFFPEAFCTSVLQDREGGHWVTTHGDGVYYFPSLDARYLPMQGNAPGKDVKCLQAVDANHLAAGLANGHVVLIDRRTLRTTTFPRWDSENKNNRVLDIQAYGKRRLLLATDHGLKELSYSGRPTDLLRRMSIKDIYVHKAGFLFASAEGLFSMDSHTGQYFCPYGQRTTCVGGIGNTLLVGTLHGLYAWAGQTWQYLGDAYPHLSVSITHVDRGLDSAAWISTPEGLVLLKNGHTYTLGRQQGLPSDLCKRVAVMANTAWISTDKGICRMGFRWKADTLVYSVTGITEADGLLSNDVSDCIVAGGFVWAATATGISFFPKYYTPHSMQRPLVGAEATVRGREVSIGLSGISFRSGKEVRFRYRMLDLDSNWATTAGTQLEFSALPFGRHTFQVQSVDRWGKVSEGMKTIVLNLPAPFWMKEWFDICLYVSSLVLFGLGVYGYYRWRHRKREEGFRIRNRIAELEMMALRAQMNPHFIFNCLSSIQYYILRADVKNANLYLFKFSSLIRKILQLSAHSEITLSEELSVLGLYMELEKLRLEDRMDYCIQVEEGLSPSDVLIPSMILHPFVENAVKHGVSTEPGEKSVIRIDFRHSGDYLLCTIEDNGRGLHAPREYAPGYRSLGSNITRSRIDILNSLRRGKLLLKITDKREANPDEHGTLVQVFFHL